MNTKSSLGIPVIIAAAVLALPATAATLPAPIPRAIVSAASAWGTPTDTWAGYTGALQVWIPEAIKGGWTLQIQSADLGRQANPSGFWNTTAQYDPVTHTFTLRSPSWGGDIQANGILNIGFNGSGVLNTGFALENCKLNGQPCAAAVMTPTTAQQTLANLQATGSATTGPGTPTDPGNGGNSNPGGANPATPALEVLFSVSSAWEGGYGGNIVVKNLSTQALPAGAAGWRAQLKFPDTATARDVFKSGPWNFQVAFGAEGAVTLSPMAWSASLAAGETASSGFNGGAVANLQKAASASPSTTVLYSASATSGGNPPPIDTGGTDPTTPVDGNVGLPTGSLPGNFLFSPYKDVGISMNWNTNVMSTAVTGALSPLLQVLPTKVPAVTWAFATGECGQENWAGIKPDALAQANVNAFVNAGKDYVISTGGAAGAFTCSSPEGMRTFINRYASARLVGVDFDIEAGQSATAIDSLVRQVQAVQADYPNLRFSFTIATLGSSNGMAASAPYGNLNVTGHNVLQALKKYPINSYTINLMVMDYGPASASVCVLGGNGLCDMGQTAIQAARNLKAKYGVPFDRVELTPMIGMNDVTDELFSQQDTDVMVQWAQANQLAGLHFWSIDRDRPCSYAYASPICSSVPDVPVWGWTRQFIAALRL